LLNYFLFPFHSFHYFKLSQTLSNSLKIFVFSICSTSSYFPADIHAGPSCASAVAVVVLLLLVCHLEVDVVHVLDVHVLLAFELEVLALGQGFHGRLLHLVDLQGFLVVYVFLLLGANEEIVDFDIADVLGAPREKQNGTHLCYRQHRIHDDDLPHLLAFNRFLQVLLERHYDQEAFADKGQEGRQQPPGLVLLI